MTITRRELLQGAAAAAPPRWRPARWPGPPRPRPPRSASWWSPRAATSPYLDPHLSTSSNDIRISFNLFDNLTSRRPDGKLMPGLATEWKLQGQTAWVFKLRPGVKWHNGDPFTSADVKFSIERTLDTTLKGNRVSTVLTTVDRVEAPDPGTVVVHTKKPDPLLPGAAGLLRRPDRPEEVPGVGGRGRLQPEAGGHRARALRVVDQGRQDRARGQRRLLGRQARLRPPRRAGPARDGAARGRPPQGRGRHRHPAPARPGRAGQGQREHAR